MTTRIFKPAYVIEELGELGRTPDGAITNIGGTDYPYFTVGGRALLFADGSTTSPTPGLGVNLQTTYDNSVSGNIDLAAGKNFVITALNGRRFVVDAATGAVTIDGDLSVLGATTVIEGTVQNTDSLNISMPLPTTVGFSITPSIGVTPVADLVNITNLFGGPAVFSISSAGVTSLANLVVAGTINGIDIAALDAALTAHLDAAPAKHAAAQVTYSQGANVNVVGATVQAALDSIESALTSFSAAGVQGVEAVFATPSIIWNVPHNRNSRRVQVTVWDDADQILYADTVTIVDSNNVRVVFNTPATGRVILMIF